MPVVAVDGVERTPTPNDAEAIKNIPVLATEFEAATIKVNKSGAQIKRIQPKPGGRIEVDNLKLPELVTIAWNFDFDNDRIVGLPKWAEADAYDVIAKTAVLPGEKAPVFDDLRVMLRALLIERFNIKSHEEQQPVKVWTLTVAKRGAKLKDADPSTRSNCTPSMGQTGSGGSALAGDHLYLSEHHDGAAGRRDASRCRRLRRPPCGRFDRFKGRLRFRDHLDAKRRAQFIETG